MRVFVTGASGWIGSAVVPELLANGHEVLGLARSAASAEALAVKGAEVQRGDLDDVDVLRQAAAESDGVIHLAYRHDILFSGGGAEAVASDNRAITTFGEALAGSDRPLLIASGTFGLATGRVATEADGRPDTEAGRQAAHTGPRLASAQRTLALAEQGVRTSVVRLPPTVHGEGDGGFLSAIIGFDRQAGLAGYLGDGSSRWPAVHVSDAARLFRLGLEHAPAGSVLHAVDDQGVPMKAIAEVIGRHLDLPVKGIADQDAEGHFAWMAGFIGLDSPTSSTLTRKLLGWEPTGPSLIEDLEAGHYFR